MLEVLQIIYVRSVTNPMRGKSYKPYTSEVLKIMYARRITNHMREKSYRPYTLEVLQTICVWNDLLQG